MQSAKVWFAALAFTTSASTVVAQELPQMEGVWSGYIRQLSSGTQVSGEVARGGVLITHMTLTFTVIHQDGEVFMGEVSSDAPDAGSTPVWGSIRSNGKEGVLITGIGGRGNIWFESPTRLEFCVGNLREQTLSSFCGHLTKQSSSTDPS